MKKISIIIIISAFFITNTSTVAFFPAATADGPVVYSCGGVNYKSQNDSAYQSCIKKEQEESAKKAEEARRKQELEAQKIKQAELQAEEDRIEIKAKEIINIELEKERAVSNNSNTELLKTISELKAENASLRSMISTLQLQITELSNKIKPQVTIKEKVDSSKKILESVEPKKEEVKINDIKIETIEENQKDVINVPIKEIEKEDGFFTKSVNKFFRWFNKK